VPAICHERGAGTAIVNRNLIGKAESFARGTRRVYAWFAVTLPPGYHQRIKYQWYHDGDAVGPPIEATIEGGRATGFRTASHQNTPAPGRWRADLNTNALQLVDRVTFDVSP